MFRAFRTLEGAQTQEGATCTPSALTPLSHTHTHTGLHDHLFNLGVYPY